MTRQDDRNRRPLPVEQLLIWAFQVQMVHRARKLPVEIAGSSKGPLEAFSSLWSECAPVEGSRSSGFEASDDAWHIHDLVMQLRPVKVDCGHDLAASRYHALGQYRGAEPPVGSAGTLDQTARPWPTDGMLDIDLPALVMIHASKATRPALPRKPDVRFKRGPVVWHPKRRGGAYTKGWFCHVAAEGDLAGDMIEAWHVYMNWRGALIRLQSDLKLIALTMFTVTDDLPASLKKPW